MITKGIFFNFSRIQKKFFKTRVSCNVMAEDLIKKQRVEAAPNSGVRFTRKGSKFDVVETEKENRGRYVDIAVSRRPATRE